MEIILRKEAIARGLGVYFTGRPCKYGHVAKRTLNNGCCECYSAYYQTWRANNLEKCRARYRKWRDTNLEAQRRRERKSACARYRANPKRWNERTVRRRFVVKQQCPAWADLEAIKRIYENRPEGHHVDHVIPLNGKTVSGLHVETNLQYLPAFDNLSKHNSLVTEVNR